MKLFNKDNSLDNTINEYYRTKGNHLKHNIPPLKISNIIKTDTGYGRRLFINTAFTCGIIVMSGIFLLTAGNQTELEIIIKKVIENTNVIEHIRSGSINMFEILSKDFI